VNILTFDIEDWWVYNHYALGNASDYLPRLDNYLSEVLDLLDSRNYKATFFCLGEVARHYPEVLKKIASHGHHIGCHSYSHRFLGDLNPVEFIADTKLAIDCIEDIIGLKVDAYRAPAFSITEDRKWAIEILAENGIKYDCSIFPAARSFGGFPSFKENKPSIIHYNSSVIKEFPMSVTRVIGKEIAYSGGGYFRLMPYPVIKNIVNQSNYMITYFHLKDFDDKQVRRGTMLAADESLILRYFKNYYGIKGAYKKFQRFMNDFNFVSVEQASAMIDWDKAPIIRL
jgi:polysaccharide deacetylase family protein (PEP-CTERM system associated)